MQQEKSNEKQEPLSGTSGVNEQEKREFSQQINPHTNYFS